MTKKDEERRGHKQRQRVRGHIHVRVYAIIILINIIIIAIVIIGCPLKLLLGLVALAPRVINMHMNIHYKQQF